MKQSPLLESVIEAFRCLPGVGQKSAQRMVYHLLERDRDGGKHLANVLARAMEGIQHCKNCRNFCEDELCTICCSHKRDHSLICIVESPADILAIENSGGFKGTYFVLMGHLSPLDGVGPEELGLDVLEKRIQEGTVEEIIVATSATIEGEATAHYLHDLVQPFNVKLTRIAQGIPMGGELEYLDANTLARSLTERRTLNF
ncbi:recombination mediator RecR [Pleionea sp. CnH1-48]|uniref:recombination mediator RecR n=1 Tax=Pleionea sp. CnH1-48 TaxID=2954494 RepID=UPI002096CC5D|nr:recombination mediator RecR [Pleionea sp. CnH1-48]MCO7222836.1 recombination mediator RecR [Pleionea sp. CnH1-48]